MHVFFTESLSYFFHFLHVFNFNIFCVIPSQKKVPCEHNSFYSFILILLKSVVGTMWAQLLVQFYTDPFETLQAF